MNDAAVRDLPSLNQFTVTSFPAASEGNTFRFKIKVFTTAREADSGIGYFILADVPDTPSDQPLEDTGDTSDSQIVVTFASTEPDDGGSPITSFEL